MKHRGLVRFLLSLLFLALAVFLPLVTDGIPGVGTGLLAMQLPVLLCGYVCGGGWGFLVGALAPVIRSLALASGPLYPDAVVLLFETGAMGYFAGLFYRGSNRGVVMSFLALLLAWVLGRFVGGVAELVTIFLADRTADYLAVLGSFWPRFLDRTVFSVIPGMVLQLIVVPTVGIAARNSRVMKG